MSRVLPILFNTDMVKAILDGRKTVTRRLVKAGKKSTPEYHGRDKFYGIVDHLNNDYKNSYAGFYNDADIFYIEGEKHIDAIYYKAPCKPGDILYVRETWSEWTDGYVYKAWSEPFPQPGKAAVMKWHPSLHMPKEAARIFLKVKDVRVERLQDITEEQAEAEGFQFTPPCLSQVSEDSYCDLDGPCTSKVKYCDMSAGELFGKVLWNSTIKKSDLALYGWEANPWVWVIEF